MNVRIASEAWICRSFVRTSESTLWILIWIWSWDPLRLCDAIRRTTPAPPGQNPGRARPRSAHSPLQKSRQQRSDQPSKPVKSEQDNCSFDSNHGLHTVRMHSRWGGTCFFRPPSGAERLALPDDPVDQACGIQHPVRRAGRFLSMAIEGSERLRSRLRLRICTRA